jgi:outer membrane protein TolC
MLMVIPLLLAATGLAVAAADAPPTRPISLDECVEMALHKNLDLRIERYNPQIALFDVAAAKAGYDPTLNASGSHSHNEFSSQLFASGVVLPNSTTDTDTFSTGVGGVSPWGMSYGLTATGTKDISRNSDTNLNMFTTTSSEGSVQLDVTQPLLKNLWIDATRLNIAVAKNRAKQTEYVLKGRVIDVVTTVELAYYDLEFGLETVKVQQKALELAQRLLAENRKRVEVGALAPLDEKQSEAEVAGRQADLIAAQRNLSLLENALKQAINDDFGSWQGQALEPAPSAPAERQLFNLQDSWTRGLEDRPDYVQAKLDLEREGYQLKFDHNQLYPQLDAFGTYGYNGSGVGLNDAFNDTKGLDRPFYTFGGRLVYPLGNGAARNRYKSTQAVHEQSLLSLKRLEQNIMVSIDNAIKLAQSNFERIDATRKAREYAEAALSAEQKKLENGKSTSFVVLQLQKDLTTARSDEISAIVQYKRSLAQLAQAEGTTLERRKINFEVK